ncbi:MAG TPA: oligosaccharide flippase family protein [Kofleriaceae bacterium]
MTEQSDVDGARLRRDVIWNVVPVGLLAIVGLGLQFMIGRWWGAEALGAFNLVTPAFFAYAVIGACGLQYSVLRAIAEDPHDPERVASVAVGAVVPTVVFAAAAAAACCAFAPALGHLLDSPRVTIGLRMVAPGVFFFALNKVLFGIVNGLRRMRAFAIYTSLRYILIAIALVGARVMEIDGAQLGGLWSFAEGALMLVLLGEMFATVKVRGASSWMRWVRAHVSYGARGLPATLLFEVNSKLDVWMLGIALDDHAVGIYALAAALFEGAMQLGVVVTNNVNPVLAHELAGKRVELIHILVKRTRRWFVPLMLVACIASAVLYPYVVPLLVGNAEFAQGAIPFAFLMAGLALSSPWQPFNQMLLMAAKPGWHTVMSALVFAVAFVGNYVLIPTLGLEGAAIATAVGLVVGCVLLVGMVRKITGVRL